jgi:putative FmdB family regulatory protein
MPIYEYECKKCKFKIEKVQKFNDSPLLLCEKCNGPMQKLISSPNIRFKGSGWYVTDYAKKPDTTNDIKEEKKEVKAETTSSADTTSTANSASAETSKGSSDKAH